MFINIQDDVVSEIENRLSMLAESTGSKLITGKVRAISTSVFNQLTDRNIETVLKLCEELLEQRKWAFGVIAYDWAFKLKHQYKRETFYVFDEWLQKYVTGWGDCDDFCTHAFGELLSQYSDLFPKVLEWTTNSDFWVRRASAVILIYPIKKRNYPPLLPFEVTNRLMHDEHHLVLKGYGWMLKILSKDSEVEVRDYLIHNKDVMPRVSLRYAIESMTQESKQMILK